jgi:hypothetical protein
MRFWTQLFASIRRHHQRAMRAARLLQKFADDQVTVREQQHPTLYDEWPGAEEAELRKP